ncbi:MAG: L-aspartate oxidase [Saprospiraceae bacterium]|nr:L-aspartate oxidase [Saprospiraceae bacterium]MDP4997322.1 L-aspartate oxidase [Saprospiraceae bacterium]
MQQQPLQHNSDVLIIGAGIGGLTTAIKLATQDPALRITVLTKTDESESNTRYAQGGVAAVWDTSVDSFDKHIEDTLIAGDGLCDEAIVRIVVEEGPVRVREIIEWGARFDKNRQENYDLGKEGGHSANRILHYKDITGWEIQRTLLEKAHQLPNITLYDHYFAVDLITQHHLGYTVTRLMPDIECYGAYALNKSNGQIETFRSKITVIATGGAGQVYRDTTNPVIATGDGIAMAYRAKCWIENMEFVQFHPTALYNPAGENPAFLVSEAVRGFGGILKRKDGRPFMEEYDPRGSLAPRDIVARAIDNEMKISGEECMYLDCRHLDKADFLAHFPNIYDKCLSIGIDPMENMIPIVPACHYFCGGIRVDEQGKSSINRLFACGECTSTGLHGANRLASNSLLEALVFGHRIAASVREQLPAIGLQEGIPDWNAAGTTQPGEMVLITQSLKELKEIMSSYVGIVRSDARLKRALDRLHLLFEETEALYDHTVLSPQLCQLRNLITIGYLIARTASLRKESRGLHYTTDYRQQQNIKQEFIL